MRPGLGFVGLDPIARRKFAGVERGLESGAFFLKVLVSRLEHVVDERTDDRIILARFLVDANGDWLLVVGIEHEQPVFDVQ
jgi:hypothetical protein